MNGQPRSRIGFCGPSSRSILHHYCVHLRAVTRFFHTLSASAGDSGPHARPHRGKCLSRPMNRRTLARADKLVRP